MADACPTIPHGNTNEEWSAAHQRLRDNQATWNCLAFAGLQVDDQGSVVECRQCPSCQSTISRPISAESAAEVFEQQASVLIRSVGALKTVASASPLHSAALPDEDGDSDVGDLSRPILTALTARRLGRRRTTVRCHRVTLISVGGTNDEG